MTKREYYALIAEWRRKYDGKTYYVGNTPYIPFQPSSLTIAPKKCIACGRSPTQRHHRGSEFIFARMMPDLFAGRYIQYHPDDCVDLCRRCHLLVTKELRKVQAEMWVDKSQVFDQFGMPVNEKFCNHWRQVFIDTTNQWILKRQKNIATYNKRKDGAKQGRKGVRKNRSKGRNVR